MHLKDSNTSIDFCCRSSNWTAVIPNFLDCICHSNMDTCASTMHWIINKRFAMQISLLCSANFIVDNINLQDWMSDSIDHTQYRTQYRTRYQYDIGYNTVADIEYVSIMMLSIYLTSGRSRSRIRNGRFNIRIFMRSPVMCFPSCCLMYMS